MLPDPGANDALSIADIPDDVFDRGTLHVSGYALLRHGPRAAALTAMDRARDAGMKISVDPASAAPLANDPVFLDRITPIDLLLPNEDEVEVLGRQLNVPEIVITRGARGSTWTDGFESVDERAMPADVVDTTGAGDAFAAGFLSVWPGSVPDALAAGARLAAEAVQRRGGRPYD
jgi:sugar/nucleoside kinase (ribokinase family)